LKIVSPTASQQSNIEVKLSAPRPGTKKLSDSKQRPSEVPATMVMPSAVTDVFLDFDGTLTVKSTRRHEFMLPVMDRLRGLSVCDSAAAVPSATGALSWSQYDAAMAECVPKVGIDVSDDSAFGPVAARAMLQDALDQLTAYGVRVHLLTMGTPLTCKALLQAAKYDTDAFHDWLGPTDMAQNQGLRHLFENGEEQAFEFAVEEDIAALESLRDHGVASPLLLRQLSMEKRLSKAALMSARAGRGGVLVDDNWARNIFDARENSTMYVHVDPEGMATTAESLSSLAEQIRKERQRSAA